MTGLPNEREQHSPFRGFSNTSSGRHEIPRRSHTSLSPLTVRCFLLLPGLLRIKPSLTPFAAAGLVVIMVGAALTVAADGFAAGVVPLVVGLLAAFVAYGRWRLAPHPARREMIRKVSKW